MVGPDLVRVESDLLNDVNGGLTRGGLDRRFWN